MNTNRKIGNLMLVEVNKQKEDKDLIRCKNLIRMLNDSFRWEFKDYSFSSVAENWKPIQAIVVCDDEIKVGENWLNTKDPSLGIRVASEYDIKKIKDNNHTHCKKVLVLPNQFSSSFIQAILNGKIKDGDKVEVELNNVVIAESTDNYDDNVIYVNGDKVFSYSHEFGDILEKEADKYRGEIKLRRDNTATIHPYKETIAEASEKYNNSLQFDLDEELSKLNTPARYDAIKKRYNYSEMDIMSLFIKAERGRNILKAFEAGAKWKENNKNQ